MDAAQYENLNHLLRSIDASLREIGALLQRQQQVYVERRVTPDYWPWGNVKQQ